MGFFRQEYWSGFPCPPPEDLPNPGIEPESLTSPALQEGSLPLAPPGKPKVKVTQSCQTVFNPMNCSPPGSSICGILQATILEWVAIPFFRGSSQPRDWIWVYCIAGRFITVWATSKPLTIEEDPLLLEEEFMCKELPNHHECSTSGKLAAKELPGWALTKLEWCER